MAISTEQVLGPQTDHQSTPKPPHRPRRTLAVAGWIAVIVSLGAAGLLAVLVLRSSGAAVEPVELPSLSQTVAERGSVSAVEHRDLATRTASQTAAERGSVSAVEHRDLAARRASQTVAEHGSVSAVEHRDLAARTASQTVAERGSVAAVEQRDTAKS